MAPRSPAYHCRRCGASCYRRVIERALDGAMRPAGRYRCTGCDLVFADLRDWHGAGMAPPWVGATAGSPPAPPS